MFNIAHPHLLMENCAGVLVETTEGFNIDAIFRLTHPHNVQLFEGQILPAQLR
jgi:hypothetical protein